MNLSTINTARLPGPGDCAPPEIDEEDSPWDGMGILAEEIERALARFYRARTKDDLQAAMACMAEIKSTLEGAV